VLVQEDDIGCWRAVCSGHGVEEWADLVSGGGANNNGLVRVPLYSRNEQALNAFAPSSEEDLILERRGGQQVREVGRSNSLSAIIIMVCSKVLRSR
jgi:hypothetical protein